jgi:hypothetical protein
MQAMVFLVTHIGGIVWARGTISGDMTAIIQLFTIHPAL